MTLICLYGLPASGKTTLVRRISERISTNVFSFDLLPIESTIYAEYRKKCEQEVRHYLELHSETIRGKKAVVIVDDVCYLRSMRRVFHRMANKFGLNFVSICVSCSLADCLTRNAKRRSPQQVEEQTIRRLNEALEISDDSWIYNENLDDLMNYVNSLPLLDLPTTDLPSHDGQNSVCDVDMISREAVAKIRLSFESFDGRTMSQLRKEFVAEFKKKKITFEDASDLLLERYKLKVG
ncbi:unnamed protein product, partial [Mesorhabditis belari]|uniref:Uncharacterized protein n=1 Tax=Mesorhabditis belari TaxID=2138241 RepID=A0AAF3FDE5_9BILA